LPHRPVDRVDARYLFTMWIVVTPVTTLPASFTEVVRV
jgi:hypothetical protein